MGNIGLNKLYVIGIALKTISFDVLIVVKIPNSKVLITIRPNRSLLTFRYHELFDTLAIELSCVLFRISCLTTFMTQNTL